MIDYRISDEDAGLYIRPKHRRRLQDTVIDVARLIIALGFGVLMTFGIAALLQIASRG